MKKLLLAVLAIVVLVVIGLTVAVRFLIDPERVRAAIETQASAALHTPVIIERAALSLWPAARLTLRGVQIGEPSRLTLQTVDVATDLRALLSRRIENAELTVADSTVDVPALMAALGSLEPGTAPVEGTPTSAPLTLVNIKAISFRNVRMTFDGRAATVSLESSLSGDRLDITSFDLASPVTTLEASGAIESLAARKAKFTVSAETLDLDGMMALLAGAQGTQGAQGAKGTQGPGAVDLTLDLSAARGQAAGVQFSDLKTVVHATERAIRLEPIGLALFGGRVDGQANVDVARDEPALSVDATLSGIDMNAVASHAGQPGSISGRLGGTIHLTGAGASPAAAFSTATGRGDLAIADGVVPNLHLVRDIVLAFGKPAPGSAAGGDAFKQIAARLQLARRVVRFTDLTFHSADVDFRGAGTLALAGGALDVAGRATLSEALTAQAGRDLIRYAAEDNRVTVPLFITGRISDPRVGIDAAEVLRRAATNELKSQIKKETGRLLDRLTGKKKP